MAEDRWFKIINDEIDDISKRVEQLKSEYWRKASLFMVLVIAGCATMGVAKANGIVAIGCFVAVTGILGILALATMCHIQLCLYRLIKEMRNQEEDKSEQTDAPDKK
jgi:hypothetical protein